MSQNTVLQSIEKVLKRINTEQPPYETLRENGDLTGWLPELNELCEIFNFSSMEMAIFCLFIRDGRDTVSLSESHLTSKLNTQLRMPNYLIRRILSQLRKNEIIETKGRRENNAEFHLSEKYEEAVFSGDWKRIESLTPRGLMPFLGNYLKKRRTFETVVSEIWDSSFSSSDILDNLHLDKNENLQCVKFVKQYLQTNKGPQFQVYLFLSVLANKVYYSDDTNVSHFCYRLDMPRFEVDEFINRYIKTGTWEPIKMGYIEIAGAEQLDEDIELELTTLGITELLPELDEAALEYISKKSNLGIPIIQPEKIKYIELLFDKEMIQLLSPLKYALSPEILPKIKEISKARSTGVCALFYGQPGTGKTEWCYQLAREFELPIFEVNISDIQDKWVGNSEKNARRVFQDYKRICKHYKKDVILLFNEADALFGRRLDAKSSVDQMNNALKNIFLEEMEKLDGILLATTNLSQSLDSAFERRFLFKFKFTKPSADTQSKLWLKYFEGLSQEQALALSKRFNFSPAQISNVQRRLEIERLLYPDVGYLSTIERVALNENLEDATDKKVMGF